MRRLMLLKVIAVQEIVGGAVAPFMFSFMLIELARAGFPVDKLAPSVVVISLYLLAIFAGVMLWRDRPIGYAASVVVQLAQLFKVATPQFAFIIGFGGDLAIVSVVHQDATGRQLRVLTFHSHAGPQAVVEFSRPPLAPQVFGVSVISCIALVVLRKGRQPVVVGDSPLSDEVSAPASERRGDGQPDWILPFWLKIAIGLFVVVVASCAGSLVLSR